MDNDTSDTRNRTAPIMNFFISVTEQEKHILLKLLQVVQIVNSPGKKCPCFR